MADRETLDFDDPMQRPRFTGLATFFRLPYREDFEADPPQIGVCGVPYDGGVTNRPGPRHGPREVRNQSSLMRRVNQATGASPFTAAKVADIGDAWIRKPYELVGAHQEIEDYFARVKAAGIRALACGGDHSVSLPILRALAKDGPPLGMIHIDAHADTGDDYGGSRFHHGAPFKVAVDEGLPAQPAENLVVLGDDEGEQSCLDRVGLAIEPAVAIFAAIQVVRRKGDEPALGQPGGEVVVGRAVGVDRVARDAVSTVFS